MAAGGLQEEGVCCPCLHPEPLAQPGGCAEACDGASPTFGVDSGMLKVYVDAAFESGLQDIEGWLDFEGASWDLDILEADILDGGTQMSKDGRAKLISSLRWRLKDFLRQAGQVRTFWVKAVGEADPSAQDFMACATALSAASPNQYVGEVCDHLEADIRAFVCRVAGGGSGFFGHEAAGNFVLMVEAVEDCMRQARRMQDTLEKLAEEGLAAWGRPPARRVGPSSALGCCAAQEAGFSATEALWMASSGGAWTLADGEAELSLFSEASSPFGLPAPSVHPGGPMHAEPLPAGAHPYSCRGN